MKNPLDTLVGRAAFSAFIALACTAKLQAHDPTKTNYPTNFPKRLHWKGKVKGKTVTMDIEAGAFVVADHRIEDHGGIIDGYRSLPGYETGWGSGFPYFIIRNWRMRWGGKPLHLPRGVYTSVFTPKLTGPAPYLGSGVGVCVTTADREDALVVTINCGYDAVTLTVTFVITENGGVYRFVSGGNS